MRQKEKHVWLFCGKTDEILTECEHSEHKQRRSHLMFSGALRFLILMFLQSGNLLFERKYNQSL